MPPRLRVKHLDRVCVVMGKQLGGDDGFEVVELIQKIFLTFIIKWIACVVEVRGIELLDGGYVSFKKFKDLKIQRSISTFC